MKLSPTEITRTADGVELVQTGIERVSPAYAPFETVFVKTVSIRPGPGRYADRLYADVRTTRNDIVTGVHHFPADEANRSTLAHFVGDELADELLSRFTS